MLARATIGTPFAFSAYAARNRFAATFAIGTVTAALCAVVTVSASVFHNCATTAAMDTLAMVFAVIAMGANSFHCLAAMLTVGALATIGFCAIIASAANRARVYFLSAIRAGNTVAIIAILICTAILASLFTLAL